jgi:hypothetical protein
MWLSLIKLAYHLTKLSLFKGVRLMANLSDLAAVVSAIDASVDKVAAKIAALVAQLNAGGLSATEADALKAQLVALQAKVDGLSS